MTLTVLSDKTRATVLLAVTFCCVLGSNMDAQTDVRRLYTGPDSVPGAEYAAAVNFVNKNVKATATVFVPDSAKRIRAAIILVEQGPRTPLAAQGRFGDMAWRSLASECGCALVHLRLDTIRAFDQTTPITSHVLRNAAVGGADALMALLQTLGRESSRPDLAEAPMLFWGWSSAASFGTTFAELFPHRTVAFIRYHTQLRGVPADIDKLKSIPALLLAGAKDETAGTSDTNALFTKARAAGAPWTFAIEPDATHASEESLVQTHELIMPWILGVVALRTTPGTNAVKPISDSEGVLVNQTTAAITPVGKFQGEKSEASWLPNDAAAKGWVAVTRAGK